MHLTSTWGRKHEEGRKAKTEREGRMERRLERVDRCRSAGRRRLWWWGVKNLSAWERRSKVNQGGIGRGTQGNLRLCATIHQNNTSQGTTNHNAQGLCIARWEQADKHKLEVGNNSSLCLHLPLKKREEQTDFGAPCQSPTDEANG